MFMKLRFLITRYTIDVFHILNKHPAVSIIYNIHMNLISLGKPGAQVLFCPIQTDQWEWSGQASL